MDCLAIQGFSIHGLECNDLKFFAWRPAKTFFEQVPPQYVQHIRFARARPAVQCPAKSLRVCFGCPAAILPRGCFVLDPGTNGFNKG